MPAESWPAFAFSETSAWGLCYHAFLRRAFEKSGSQSTLDHYRQALVLFFTEPAKLPDAYTRSDVESFLHYPGRALGRVGRVEDIAWPTVFLLSEGASYINGTTIVADGGRWRDGR